MQWDVWHLEVDMLLVLIFLMKIHFQIRKKKQHINAEMF